MPKTNHSISLRGGTVATRTALPNPQQRNLRKVLVASLAGQTYGIGLHVIQEILPLPLLSQPPGLPPVLAGFLNLGGAAIPVVKLARLFGLVEREWQMYTPLVVLRSAEQTLAVLVDAVEGIASVDEAELLPFRENDCAQGLVLIGDANVILLSDRQLLRAQEQRRLAELTAIEQSRLDSFREALS